MDPEGAARNSDVLTQQLALGDVSAVVSVTEGRTTWDSHEHSSIEKKVPVAQLSHQRVI